MATMLVYFFTNADLDGAALREVLVGAADRTFNSLSVDTDTSTSDSVVVFSTRTAPLDDALRADFADAFRAMSLKLARDVVAQAEGSTQPHRLHGSRRHVGARREDHREEDRQFAAREGRRLRGRPQLGTRRHGHRQARRAPRDPRDRRRRRDHRDHGADGLRPRPRHRPRPPRLSPRASKSRRAWESTSSSARAATPRPSGAATSATGTSRSTRITPPRATTGHSREASRHLRRRGSPFAARAIDSSRRASPSPRVARPSRRVTPDSRRVTPDSRGVAPDSRRVAPDSRGVAPDSDERTLPSRRRPRSFAPVARPSVGVDRSHGRQPGPSARSRTFFEKSASRLRKNAFCGPL